MRPYRVPGKRSLLEKILSLKCSLENNVFLFGYASFSDSGFLHVCRVSLTYRRIKVRGRMETDEDNCGRRERRLWEIDPIADHSARLSEPCFQIRPVCGCGFQYESERSPGGLH